MPGLVTAVRGEDKTGKTSLALSVVDYLQPPADKVLHMELDIGGFERSAWRYREYINSGRIVNKRYHIPLKSIRDELMKPYKEAKILSGYKELWYGKLLPDYVDALEDPTVGAIIVDSWKMWWDFCTSCLLQEKQEIARKDNKFREKLQQIEYGEANGRMRTAAYASKEAGKHLILVHPMTDERQQKMSRDGVLESVPTGRRLEEGWKHIGSVCDILVETQHKEIIEGSRKVPKFLMKVILSGSAKSTEGMEFQDPSFSTLMQLTEMARTV